MAEPTGTHSDQVATILKDAAAEHLLLLAQLPAEIARSLPVDAQGLQRAIDHLALAAGFDDEQRKSLVRPHATNPALLHARVFGAEGLTDSTVVGAFVEGARVRAEALGALADDIGGEGLGPRVRALLSDNPPPADTDPDPTLALIDTYKSQEQAALLIATALDALA